MRQPSSRLQFGLLVLVYLLKRASLQSAPPRQTNRQIKCQRVDCGYIVRTSRHWIDINVPVCPVHLTEMKVE